MSINFARMRRNIHTSLAGLTLIIATISGIVEKGSIEFKDIAQLSAGVGLLAAKDSNVTGGTKANSTEASQ